MALVEHNHWWPSLLFLVCSFLSVFFLLASLPFHRFDMPAHGDCQFRDEWLVQDKYKEWVLKDGDPRLPRCKLKFCMKSSMQKFEERRLKKCQLPDELSALGAFEKVRVESRCRDVCLCYLYVVYIMFWIHYNK